MNNHPNATAAAGSGTLAVLVVWAVGLFGVDVAPEIGAAIAGAVITTTLFIGRKGLAGLFNMILHGSSNNEPPVS